MAMRKAGLLLFAVAVAGCAAIEPRAGFEEVQSMVRERAGHDIRWYGATEEDAQVEQAVVRLLDLSGGGDGLTADAAVQIALLNNRRLQAVYEALSVSQAELVQAGLLSNPVFDAAAKFPLSGGQVELEFAIAQEFLSIFFLPLRKRVAEANFERVKLEVTGRVLDLSAHTLAAYYRAQAAEQILEMRRQVVQATAASFDLAQRLREAGNITAVELGNERALHEQARLDLAAAEAEVAQTREALNRLMGLWGDDTQWTMSSRLPELREEPTGLETVEREAVAQSLDVAIVRQEIEAFGRRLGLTRAATLIPSAELGAGAEREEGEWEVGPSVSLPIPLFDMGQARLAAAKAELRRLQQLYWAIAVEVRSAARAARQRLLSAQRIAAHYRQVMLPLRQELVEQTQLQFNAMQVGTFELLLAKQRQIETGRRYIESLRNYWLARVQLEQIRRGRITDLGLTEPLSPEPVVPEEGPGDPQVSD